MLLFWITSNALSPSHHTSIYCKHLLLWRSIRNKENKTRDTIITLITRIHKLTLTFHRHTSILASIERYSHAGWFQIFSMWNTHFSNSFDIWFKNEYFGWNFCGFIHLLFLFWIFAFIFQVKEFVPLLNGFLWKKIVHFK